MEHKAYLKFLSLITTSEAGSFDVCKLKIFFHWNSERGILIFSCGLAGDEGVPQREGLSRQLKWKNDQPYFEQQNENLFLSLNVHGIPTFVEFKDLIKNFISVYKEFNDQSMGSLAQLLR